jgi:hypothetical protein
MFRSLVRLLTPKRPQAQTRPQVQRFRPKLEVLEDRLAPSSWGGFDFSHNNIVVQVQNQEHVYSHNTQIQVAVVGNSFGGHSGHGW